MPIDPTHEQKARAALASNPFPEMPWIQVRDDGISIATGYSEALHRLLRWVPKAQWRTAERCWHIPFSGVEAVRAVLPEIARLAEAARELDAPARRGEIAGAAERPDLLQRFVEAATLLHGPDWRAVLAGETTANRIADWIDGRSEPEPSDPLVTDLSVGLRQKALALTRAAELLESALVGAPGDDRT